ncbi:hypothetical protein J2X73_003329 [Novosphingobium sp. 1748]|uniref:hypothetical protein n=1 Tax=unclassified Novosphingobium TaxID=2644732 RepID=UPI001AC4DEAC|nr:MULTISPECIES: hypothetical protein [unclassified Novosphingobium]MBN9145021.1 hypothetical protein [Novosphingobium sp.]MDR6708942.1 hypothetical protein [Novosphingobium sp. 1748]
MKTPYWLSVYSPAILLPCRGCPIASRRAFMMGRWRQAGPAPIPPYFGPFSGHLLNIPKGCDPFYLAIAALKPNLLLQRSKCYTIVFNFFRETSAYFLHILENFVS